MKILGKTFIGLIILVGLLVSVPASAQVIWTPKDGVVIHPENTSVWITWNCIYESQQPCVVDTTYFVVGGVKWVIDATGAVNVSIDRYTPEDLYQDGGIGFNLTVTPRQPCKISFDIVGVPRGLYVVHKITAIEVSNITLHASELNFTDYVDRPTRYVIQIVKFEGVPTVTPEIPTQEITPTPTKPCKLPMPGFEAIFAIAGLISVAYLLNRNRSS